MKTHYEKRMTFFLLPFLTILLFTAALSANAQSIKQSREVIEGYVGWANNPDSLGVYIDDTWTEAEKDSVRAGIARWNDAGCTPKFKEVSSSAGADITITQGNPGEGNAGLIEWHEDDDGKITDATITIAEETSPLSIKEVVTHELGHAIGLDDTDEAANGSDVMKGSGPSNGSDGNLSQHDSTEMRQATQSITAIGEDPTPHENATFPEKAIAPGEFTDLNFALPGFYPPETFVSVIPVEDPLLFVEYAFLEDDHLMVGVFSDPMHGSGKIYLDIFIDPSPFGEPYHFWGVHYINMFPVPPIDFECPFEVIPFGDHVIVNWRELTNYPFENPLRSHLLLDESTYFNVKPNGDYFIPVEPGPHFLQLFVDDYQVNFASFAGEIVMPDITPPWEEPFEDYPLGSDIIGLNGWEFWFGSSTSASARVTNEQIHSGQNALQILGKPDMTGDDIVHQFSGCTSGVWELTAWQFIPAQANNGSSYITLLNQYGLTLEECNWSTQLAFNTQTNLVESQFEGAVLPLVKGEWVEINVFLDFDNDVQTIKYNGDLLSTKSWTEGILPEGQNGIAALNLFSGDLTEYVYYDDLSLLPYEPPVSTGILKVGDWMKSEEWHRWIGNDTDEIKVEFYPEQSEGILYVDFYFSIAGTGEWVFFYSDNDGVTGLAPGPLSDGSEEFDGWSGYLDHALLPDVNVELDFRADVFTVDSFFDVFTELSIEWDVTPPSAVSTNLFDYYITDEPTILLEVLPEGANIAYLEIETEPKFSYFEKGVPPAYQPGNMDCGPTALAACLKYFESHGYPNICGGLSMEDLIEQLKNYCVTDPENGTWDNKLESGALRWINEHGDGMTVRRTGFNWKQMRNELERGQDVITLFQWEDADGLHGHFMTFNSVSNIPEPDGRIMIDFMDPWSGEIIDGYINPQTGEVNGFTDSQGNVFPPDGSWVFSNVIICPMESAIIPGTGTIIPWPILTPYPIPLDTPGLYWIRIQVIDEDGNKSRLDYPVEYVSQTQEPTDLVLVPDNKTNPEPWYQWITGPDGYTPVSLRLNDPDNQVERVRFYDTQNPDLTGWQLFDTDDDGFAYIAPGPSHGYHGEADGWCGYLPHESLIHENLPIFFRAEVETKAGSVLEVICERTLVYDANPPSSYQLTVEDGFITDEDVLTIGIIPDMANLDYAVFSVADKPEWYQKAIPFAPQQDPMSCGPYALAACLKYFANQGYDDIDGGLAVGALAEALKPYVKYHPDSGTLNTDLASGAQRWIDEHGGGFTVTGPSSFGTFGTGEMTQGLEGDGLANGISQDIIPLFQWIVTDSTGKKDTLGHFMTMSSVHNGLVNGKQRYDFMDPGDTNTDYVEGDVDPETGECSGFTGGHPPDGTIIHSTIMICPLEPAPNNSSGGTITEGPDLPPVELPLPDSGRTIVRTRAVDQDGNKHESDIIVTRVRPAQYPPGNIQVPLDSPPIKIQGGIPEGGSYSGPHVIDGWFYPIEEGIFPITYAFTYTNGFVTDIVFEITVIAADFGDAPNDTTTFFYPTLAINNGASHFMDGITYLGGLIDGEPDGQPNANATGDDLNNLADEDGISFGPIKSGSPAQVTVTTSVKGYLNGWMDFNQDGDWNDANEQIFTDEYIHFPGTVCLNYMVPNDASEGTTFARFRFASFPGLPYDGSADNGEVEDYMVNIIHDQGIKWQQEPCPENSGLHCHDYNEDGTYLYTVIADDWMCNGGLVTDIHWWGNYENMGSGIDHFHLSIHNNDPTSCLPVNTEIWGMDVTLDMVNETNTGIMNSENKFIYSYEYILDIPFDQVQGQTYWLDICAYSVNPNIPAIWRWQESDRSTVPVLCPAAYMSPSMPWSSYIWNTPQPTRYSDMAFVITSQGEPPDNLDFGDAPDDPYPTLLVNNGARHIIDGITYLGEAIDPEADGQPNIPATGDDLANVDDEDGVVFRTPLVQGKAAIIKVLASVDGILNVWLDIDRNNTWADAGDHVFVNKNLVAGWNTLTLNVPASAIVGKTYMRFRFDSHGGLSYDGLAENGEVEDYLVKILPEGFGYIPTPSTHTILVPLNVVLSGTSLSANDAIGVFYQDNGVEVCGGAELWDGVNNQVVIAYGNDNTTTEKDGFDDGDLLVWKIHHTSAGTDEYVTVAYDASMPQSDGLFATGGLSALTQINGLSVTATATPNSVCAGDLVQLDAIVSGGSGSPAYLWSSNPPGFTDNIKNPTATPTQDITYIVEVTDGGATVSASVDVAVQAGPVVSAGQNVTICETDDVPLNGSATNYSGILWTSTGDGAFDDPTLLNPSYTPGSNDISNTSVELTLTADPKLPCMVAVSDVMSVTIIHLPDVDAGGDASVCQSNSVTLTGSASAYSSVLWSAIGDGLFNDATDLVTTYTPGTNDIQNGSVTICLTAYPVSPCLLNATDCITLVILEEQTVFLFEGWNGLSSYLTPYNSSDNDELFGPVLNNLIVAYNFDGAFWPGNSNTLNWVDTSGYIAKLIADDGMLFCGDEIIDKVLTLKQGWNLIPVLSKSDVDVTQVFDAGADVKLVLEVAGWKIYWPEYLINSIINLETGKSYFVFMNSAGNIDFTNASNKSGLQENLEFVNRSPWQEGNNYPGGHTIAFAPDVLGKFAMGDVIGSFTSNGLCAGMANYDGNALGIILNGDDVYTLPVDGYQADEVIILRVFRPATQDLFDLEVEYDDALDATGRFHNFSLSAANNVKLSPVGISSYNNTQIRIYPNPSHGIFNLEGIDGEVQIYIYNSFGEEVYKQTTSNSKIIDLNKQPKGVYLTKIQTLNGTHYQKLIIN